MSDRICFVEDLQYWRAERPDEWKMDEFIRRAKQGEKAIAAMKQIRRVIKQQSFIDYPYSTIYEILREYDK
jgi:hypothetical protein